MKARWGALAVLACALPLGAWQVTPQADAKSQNEPKSEAKPKAEVKSKAGPKTQNEAKSPSGAKSKADPKSQDESKPFIIWQSAPQLVEPKSQNEAKSPAGAKPKSEADAKSPGDAAPAARELVFPPLGPVRTVNLAGHRLANGMRVYLIENHELPVVFGMAVLRAGGVFDPPDQVGLARLTGTLLRTGGTRRETGEQLDAALSAMGARIGTAVSDTTALISFWGLAESAGGVLRMVRDLLQEPAFRLERLEFAKAQTRAALAQQSEDSVAAVRRDLASALYGQGTPYGRLEDEAAIGRIQRADVEAFYKRYYFPANLTLAVEGDFDAAKLRAEIEEQFAGWVAGQLAVPEFPPVGPAPAPATYVAADKNLARTAFAIGQPGGVWRDRDAAALAVMMGILGGSRHGRLVDRVQSSAASPTQIGAFWEPKFAYPGLLEIAASTSSVSFPRVLETIHTEVERLRSSEVTDQELRWSKDAVLETLAREGDSEIKRLARDLECDFFGYPAGFAAQYQKAVAAVTRADVQRLAKERLQWERFTLVAAGDAGDLRRQLASVGRPVRGFDVQVAHAKTEPPASNAESTRRLLARAIEACGGLEKLSALKDLTETVSWENGPQAGGGLALETRRWMPPTFYRQEVNGPEGRATVYTDGRAGWISTGQGTGALGGAVLERVKSDIFRLYPRLLLSGAVEGREAYALDDQAIEIREGERVAQVIFDGASGLPSKILYQETAANGSPVAVEEDLLDFREVEGIKLPFSVKMLRNGQEAAVLTVREAKINQGLKLSDLSRRP